MTLDEFVEDFGELFENEEKLFFQPDDKFRDIEGWSSITVLSLIAMLDEKYKTRLTGEEIARSVTIEDIYNLVKLKNPNNIQ